MKHLYAGSKMGIETELDTAKPKSHNRHRIDIEQAHEVRYWTAVLGVDRETLLDAVRRAGTTPQAVRRFLREGRHSA